jgi:hypothetical protein
MSFVYEKKGGFQRDVKEKGAGLIFIISAPSGTGNPDQEGHGTGARPPIFRLLYHPLAEAE